MKQKILIILCVSFLFGCENNTSVKQKKISVSSEGEIDGFEKFQIKSQEGVLFNFYLDKDGKLIQISDSTTDNFRVIFDDSGLIQLVENRCPSLKKRSYQFDNVNNIISIVEENNKMLREVRLFNIGDKSPSIDYSVTRIDDDLHFSSEYASFDFATWDDGSPESRENIILIKKPKVIVPNENNLWQFQIFSKGDKNLLLKSDYDANFDTKKRIDTFLINQTFTYSHNPSKEKDTIRFIILNENSKNEMQKSFYYQLPID